MTHLLGDTLRSLATEALRGAREGPGPAPSAFAVSLAAGLACVLAGAAGVGFLTAAAYLALLGVVGAGWAAVLIGVAYLLLAGLFSILVRGRLSDHRPEPVRAPLPSPAPDPDPVSATLDAATLLAFTTAYVLARRLTRGTHR